MGCGASVDEIIDPGHINITHFSIERVLGQGGFGKVNACIHKMTGRWFAIKALSKLEIINKQDSSSILNERNLLVELQSEYIVNIYFAFQDDYTCYLVMDLCLGGDLRYQLNHHPSKRFDELLSKFYVARILKALEYLHALKIIHRDIKPDNLLLDDKGYVKLTDFGISQRLNSDGYCYAGSGTRAYMALEILRAGRKHHHCADFYALGVLTYEFLSGTWPYKSSPSTITNGSSQQNMDPKEAVSKIDKISIECQDFVTQLLVQDYHHRLGYKTGVKELIQHKWFDSFDWTTFNDKSMKPSFIPNINVANCDTGQKDLESVFNPEKEERPKISEENQQVFGGYNYNTTIKFDETGKPLFSHEEKQS